MSEGYQSKRFALFRMYPTACICALLTLVFAGASFYLNGTIDELENERQMREHEGEQSLTKLVSGPPLRQELSTVREATLRLESNLVVEDNLAENLWYFYKIEDDTHVRLKELRQVNGGMQFNTKFRKVPYEIDAVGTYSSLAHFLRAIETGSRLARINSFSLQRRSQGSGMVIDCELSVELLGKHP